MVSIVEEQVMSTHTATVVNGQLQLDTPLPLPDNSRVTVTVAPLHERHLKSPLAVG
jgi:hypothetical protein